MENSFDALYERLEPHVRAFEQKRKEMRSRGLRVALVVVAVVVVAALAIIQAVNVLFGLIAAVALALGWAIVDYRSAQLSGYYKANIVPLMLDEVLPGACYEPDGGISEADFCACGLFNAPDRYRAEDFIAGRVGKTDLCFSEVHAEERHVVHTKNGTREQWSDIFRGFLFVADFHKDFSGETLLFRNSWLKFRLGGGTRVKLENKEFERCFDVYSTDEVEARYLLSPSTMERLVTLNDRLGGNITVSFHRSRVYVAVPSMVNHFEASVWFPLTAGDLEREFRTLSDLVAIVDELNLNVRIWSKE